MYNGRELSCTATKGLTQWFRRRIPRDASPRGENHKGPPPHHDLHSKGEAIEMTESLRGYDIVNWLILGCRLISLCVGSHKSHELSCPLRAMAIQRLKPVIQTQGAVKILAQCYLLKSGDHKRQLQSKGKAGEAESKQSQSRKCNFAGTHMNLNGLSNGLRTASEMSTNNESKHEQWI